MYFFTNWLENQKRAVWEKGITVPSYDSNMYRKDIAGAWMRYDDYGNVNSDYGWEIDHICPQSMKGSDSLSNLQPLQWSNNRAKGDSYPYCDFNVTSQGDRNITLYRRFKVA